MKGKPRFAREGLKVVYNLPELMKHREVFTIGHSDHTRETFLTGRLKTHMRDNLKKSLVRGRDARIKRAVENSPAISGEF